MNPQYMLVLAVAGMVLVTIIFVAIWASRYVRVGPNRVLIVSGRFRWFCGPAESLCASACGLLVSGDHV